MLFCRVQLAILSMSVPAAKADPELPSTADTPRLIRKVELPVKRMTARHSKRSTGLHSRMLVTASGDLKTDDTNGMDTLAWRVSQWPDTSSTESTTEVDTGTVKDGMVVVKNPAISESERIILEEDAEECMEDTPAHICFEKFGSYGIRRLYTEEWHDIIKMGYERPDWMAHENVQRRHLFNLTLPGTHNSGTYDFQGAHAILGTGLAFGAQNQHLSIDMQLEAGIRAFDLRVSFAFSEHQLYISHGVLTVPLAHVLGQMRAFLTVRTKEVILVQVRIGRMSHKLDSRFQEPLIEEEEDPTRVPGEMVHREFVYHLGGLLATHATLINLPDGESMQNPRISSLVDLNARVLYFWEGQQVLCTDRATCARTPGWTQPWSDLAFGHPMRLGERAKVAWPVVEPACLASSWEHTVSAHPERVVKRLRNWASALESAAAAAPPVCFPPGAAIPRPHTPTLLYWADGQVTLTETENEAQRLLLGHIRDLYTRGEGFNLRSSAERTNYLLLVGFMKKNARALFTRPNVIGHDFVQPILVHRIVEAMQEQPECGWAITCKFSGSCWSASLLGPDGFCRDESEVTEALEVHAAAKGISIVWWLVTLCFMSALAACCYCCWRWRRARATKEPPHVLQDPRRVPGILRGGHLRD
mmetsp:Transcript_139898/g.389922  ORF Transcript_139898/g.389922 Transcript_139898/m.389922 type:complete len:644 (+) Transcript_139898:173-2104(+)